jgi:hypothetical protein
MKTYNTEDLYLAAFLTAQGYPVLNWNRDTGLTTFAFAENSELSQLVGAYYADQVTTSPLQYGNSLKNLKSMIHSKNNYAHTSHHNYGATR